MSDNPNGPDWWLASDGKWYPPEQRPASEPVLPAPPSDRQIGQPPGPAPATNGLAVASLTLGIIGSVFGLIPLTFFIAWICGLLALVFGLISRRNAKRGAPGKGMATAGTILGIIAIVLGVVGVAIINDTVDRFDREMEQIVRDLEERSR